MRIWFLTHRLPYAPNRGDRIRAYHILQFLRQRAEVDVFSLVHDDDERSNVATLERQAASVTTADVPVWWNRLKGVVSLLSSKPLTLSLLHAPGLGGALAQAWERRRPDLVLAYCSSMAPYAMQGALAGVPLVLDMVDVDSEKWRALGTTARIPQRWLFRREARCLRTFEAEAMRAARVTVAVNAREVDALRAINPQARALVVENGIALDTFAPPSGPEASASVVFCGVLDYAPNEDACLRLAQDIWPAVRARRPDARLQLVGAKPTARVLGLASDANGIEVTGAVPDVRPYLWSAALAAVPLRTARGVQNKVLEALAAGLPVLVSSVVSAGLPPAVAPGPRVMDSNEEFARAILEWLDLTPERRRAIAGASNLQSLSWGQQLQPLWTAIESAVGGPSIVGPSFSSGAPTSDRRRSRPT